jgi:hypothetical protein
VYFIITAWAPIHLTYLDGFTRGTVIMCGALVLSMPLGGLGLIEIVEEKSKGYGVLRNLPLTIREITAAKFLMVLLAVIVWLVYSMIVIAFGDVSPEFKIISQGYIVGCCLVALVFAAILYNAVFRFGLTGILKAFILVLPVAMMVSQGALMMLFREKINGMDMRWLAGPSGIYYIVSAGLAGLILFGLLALPAPNLLYRRGSH